MWSRLLCSWLVLACLTGATRPARGIQDIVSLMTFDGVEVDVRWTNCGFVNAFYHPTTRRVELCTELLDEPELVLRYIVAHEMAHAVIHQRGIIMTSRQHELAADELAAVMLGVTGHQAELLAGAEWMAKRSGDGLGNHPSGPVRAHLLRCAAFESAGIGFPGCNFWANMVSTWVHLLKMGE